MIPKQLLKQKLNQGTIKYNEEEAERIVSLLYQVANLDYHLYKLNQSKKTYKPTIK
jgi:hypothetical protein